MLISLLKQGNGPFILDCKQNYLTSKIKFKVLNLKQHFPPQMFSMLTQKTWVPLSLSPTSLSAFYKHLNLLDACPSSVKWKTKRSWSFLLAITFYDLTSTLSHFPQHLKDVMLLFSNERCLTNARLFGINEILPVNQLPSVAFLAIFLELARLARICTGLFSFWSHAWFRRRNVTLILFFLS